jgi:aspartyl-tRNA(Asn)/glutamyl-tRNA(Gln) amidotransferase subunit C
MVDVVAGASRYRYRAPVSIPGEDHNTRGRISMTITRDEVAHLARLARLALSDDELDMLAPQLDVILGAVEKVREVAAASVPPMSHAVGLTNVFRADVTRPSLPRMDVLDGVPAVEDDRFRVPRILDPQE